MLADPVSDFICLYKLMRDYMASDYDVRLRQQQKQYASGADIHGLPDIYHYWSNRYIAPCLQQVFGSNSITEIYVRPLTRMLDGGGASTRKFVSIGSGDCSEEIKIAKRLLELGHSNFVILGLDVAENLIKEANAAVVREGLAKYVASEFFDLNRGAFDGPIDAFIAHHSLHHIVELERLFDLIDRHLSPDGHFVACDMIGRNGHMRWPETLRYVEAIWANLADIKKYNWQHRQQHTQFLNWDCSNEGFEGIRAQDILPLLLSQFSFDGFVGCGGFIDPFVDRGYGPNFDPESAPDCDFIDLLAIANDAMLDAGQIKPTMMFADMVKKKNDDFPRVIGRRTPKFCVRYPP
jgi:SAM-dependent methyltransferase